MTAPALTRPPQHLEALQRANRIRFERGERRREIARLSRHAGADRVAGLLLDPPEEIATMTIFDLLVCIRSVGRSQVLGILRSVDCVPIAERRHISQAPDRHGGGYALSARQRVALARHLRGVGS